MSTPLPSCHYSERRQSCLGQYLRVTANSNTHNSISTSISIMLGSDRHADSQLGILACWPKQAHKEAQSTSCHQLTIKEIPSYPKDPKGMYSQLGLPRANPPRRYVCRRPALPPAGVGLPVAENHVKGFGCRCPQKSSARKMVKTVE